MIINDILSEYKYVYDVLSSCDEYFSYCDALVRDYLSTFGLVSNYLASANDEANENNKTLGKLKVICKTTSVNIIKMVSQNHLVYDAISKLEQYDFKNSIFKNEVLLFCNHGRNAINNINSLLVGLMAETHSYNLESGWPVTAKILMHFVKLYYSLSKYYMQFKGIDEMLFEKMPSKPGETEKYSRIELRSLNPTLNIESFAKDISLLSSFINQYELIMNPNGGSNEIYTQRIESGSLRVVWGSHKIELSGISNLIRAISDGIKMFRLTPSEKMINEEKARELKLKNDEKALAIINSQLNNIAQYLGLSSDNPGDVEKIQRLCLPLVRYINNNPVGMIGDYRYDLDNDLKLIELFYTENESES